MGAFLEKKRCVGGVGREMEDSEREFRGLRTRPKGEEPEILYLGDVLSWMPCWGPSETLLGLIWALWASKQPAGR